MAEVIKLMTPLNVVEQMITPDVEAAIKQINKQLTDVNIDEFDDELIDHRIIIDVDVSLSVVESEILGYLLQAAGWMDVRIVQDRVFIRIK